MLKEKKKESMVRFAMDYWRRGLCLHFDGDFWIAYDRDWDLNFWEEELPDRVVVWVTAYPYVNGATDTTNFVRLGEVARVRS